MLGERFERARHNESKMTRQAVGRFRVREGSQFWCDSCNDEVGEPFIKRARKQRFV
jgi:hypothetical protein